MTNGPLEFTRIHKVKLWITLSPTFTANWANALFTQVNSASRAIFLCGQTVDKLLIIKRRSLSTGVDKHVEVQATGQSALCKIAPQGKLQKIAPIWAFAASVD